MIYPKAKAQENTIKKYNKEINKAVNEIRAGEYFTLAEADTLIAEWRKK